MRCLLVLFYFTNHSVVRCSQPRINNVKLTFSQLFEVYIQTNKHKGQLSRKNLGEVNYVVTTIHLSHTGFTANSARIKG